MIGTHEYLRVTTVTGLIAWVPYVIVSWTYMTLTDGGAKAFWGALGTLLGVRLFFGVIEMAGSSLQWHLYAKKNIVTWMLNLLRENRFPKRYYQHDDFLNYLHRIEGDPRCKASTKDVARHMHFALGLWEQVGIRHGMRMHSASEAALELYSPKAQAPIWTGLEDDEETDDELASLDDEEEK